MDWPATVPALLAGSRAFHRPRSYSLGVRRTRTAGSPPDGTGLCKGSAKRAPGQGRGPRGRLGFAGPQAASGPRGRRLGASTSPSRGGRGRGGVCRRERALCPRRAPARGGAAPGHRLLALGSRRQAAGHAPGKDRRGLPRATWPRRASGGRTPRTGPPHPQLSQPVSHHECAGRRAHRTFSLKQNQTYLPLFGKLCAKEPVSSPTPR